MQSRSWSLLLLIFTLTMFASAQRRNPGAPGSAVRRSNLAVHIVLPNDRPLGDTPVRVQLLNTGGTPIAEQFTTGTGEAHFAGIAPGGYRVRVTGAQVEETLSGDFEVSSFEHVHMEFVRVKLATPQQTGSTQGTVSAQVLNVPASARKELDKGNEAVLRQQWTDAEKHFRKAIEKYSNYAGAYNNLGVACIQVKDYACARDAWEKATELDPHSARSFINLARLRTAERNFIQVEALLQKAIAIEPLNPEGLALLANAELVLGRFDQAIFYAHKLHTVSHPAYAVAHLIAGNALEAEHKFDEAAAEYRMVLQEAPRDPAAIRAQQALMRLQHSTAAGQQ